MSATCCPPRPAAASSGGSELPPDMPPTHRRGGGGGDDGGEFRQLCCALARWYLHTPKPVRLTLPMGEPYAKVTEYINAAVAARDTQEAIAAAQGAQS